MWCHLSIFLFVGYDVAFWFFWIKERCGIIRWVGGGGGTLMRTKLLDDSFFGNIIIVLFFKTCVLGNEGLKTRSDFFFGASLLGGGVGRKPCVLVVHETPTKAL